MMMMSSRISACECPHCGNTFRMTSADILDITHISNSMHTVIFAGGSDDDICEKDRNAATGNQNYLNLKKSKYERKLESAKKR